MRIMLYYVIFHEISYFWSQNFDPISGKKGKGRQSNGWDSFVVLELIYTTYRGKPWKIVEIGVIAFRKVFNFQFMEKKVTRKC